MILGDSARAQPCLTTNFAAPPRALTAPREIRSLTGLRFVAAAMVLLFHTADALPGAPGFEMLSSAGYAGVTFFFVLPGFVFTFSYREGGRRRDFLRRRAARILPLHVVTWAVALLVILVEGGRLSAKPLFANLVLLQAWVPREEYYYSGNGAAWSISCEAFFYLLLPLILLAARRSCGRRRTYVLVAVLTLLATFVATVHVVSPAMDTTPYLWVFPPFRLLEFVGGVVLALLYREGLLRIPVPVAAVVMACAMALATAVHHALRESLEIFPPQDIASLALLPGVLALIPAMAAGELAGRSSWLASPALVALGKWSFALYMTHQLVLRLTVQGLDGADRLSVTTGTTLQVLLLIICIALAAVTHQWIEAPLERRLRSRPRASTADRTP